MSDTPMEETIQPRNAQAIAERALAILAVVDKAHNPPSPRLGPWVERFQISNFFTKLEQAFYSQDDPSRREISIYSWKAEACVPLFWAIQQIESLPPIDEQMNWNLVPNLMQIIENPQQFIAEATCRSQEEFMQYDAEIERYSDAISNAMMTGTRPNLTVDPLVLSERKSALRWLLGQQPTWDNSSD